MYFTTYLDIWLALIAIPAIATSISGAAPATMVFQKGDFLVQTISIGNLTTDSATACTATSGSSIITATVPIWSCTSCPTNYNAIMVSPRILDGPTGILSPPPGYPALTVGTDMQVTPVAFPTTSSIPGETYRYPNSTGSTTRTVLGSSGSPLTKSSQTSNSASSGTGLVGTGSRSTQSTNSISGFPSSSQNSTSGRVSSSTRPSATSSSSQSSISGTGSTSNSINATSQSTASSNSGTSTGSATTSSVSSSGSSTSTSGSSTSSSGSSTSLVSSQSSSSANSSVVPTDFGPSVYTQTVVETGSSGTLTTVEPVLSGGGITSAIPITATATLNPTGTEASSSASSIQSQIILLVPIIQSYIDTPSKSKATDTINSINKIRPLVDNLLSDLDSSDSQSSKSCDVSTNLITDVFNAVKCTADNLEKAVDNIQGEIDDNFEDLGEIKSTLEDIEGLEDGLDEDNKQSESASQSSQTKTSTSSSTSSTESCTKTSITEDLYVNCLQTAAPGRTGQAAVSCTTSTETVSGCDLTATTTTSFASCTAVQTASDCAVVCFTQPPSTGTTQSQNCTTTCSSTTRGCQATGTTSTTTEAAACSLPPITSSASIQGPIYTAWWDYGVFCTGDCANFTDIPSNTIIPTGIPLSSLTANATPTNVTSSGSVISTTGTLSEVSSSTGTPIQVSSGTGSSVPSSSSTASLVSTIPPSTTSSPPSSTQSPTITTISTSTSLSCAATTNTAVPSGIAQTDMQDAVTDYCQWVSQTKDLTSTNDALPYYEPGGIVRLNFTSQFNVTENICADALGTVVNGCPPFSAPSGKTLDKWGGLITMKNETGGVAEFQIQVEPAEAVS